jgi:hypothetical protein
MGSGKQISAFLRIGLFLVAANGFVTAAHSQTQKPQCHGNKILEEHQPNNEYADYEAAVEEPDPQLRIKCLDDFVIKYPSSELMLSVFHEYIGTYHSLKDYTQAASYADKLLALMKKPDVETRLLDFMARGQAICFAATYGPVQTFEDRTRAKQTATEGLRALGQWRKPNNMTPDEFAEYKVKIASLFNSVANLAESGPHAPTSDSCLATPLPANSRQ